MKLTVFNAIDARQAPGWGAYLKSIGWNVERIGTTQIFIHKIPLIKRSVIKIQHPVGPIPLKEIDALAKKYGALFTIIEPHMAGYDEQHFIEQNYKKIFYAVRSYSDYQN